MTIFWLAAFVVFIIAEAATVGLVSIWFAIGAFAAFVGTLFNASLWVQLILFVVVSALTLAATRPLAKKYLTPGHKRTNADRVMDMVGVVTERIENLAGTGSVQIGGRQWRARSESGAVIEAGEKVRPVRIEGIKLIVVPQEAFEPASDAVK